MHTAFLLPVFHSLYVYTLKMWRMDLLELAISKCIFRNAKEVQNMETWKFLF